MVYYLIQSNLDIKRVKWVRLMKFEPDPNIKQVKRVDLFMT